MPVPRYTTDIPGAPLTPEADYGTGVTELRAHGVGVNFCYPTDPIGAR